MIDEMDVKYTKTKSMQNPVILSNKDEIVFYTYAVEPKINSGAR